MKKSAGVVEKNIISNRKPRRNSREGNRNSLLTRALMPPSLAWLKAPTSIQLLSVSRSLSSFVLDLTGSSSSVDLSVQKEKGEDL